MGKIGDNLQRMRELAVQSRNATNSTSDRASLQKEFGQLQAEISRTIKSASFNNAPLLNNPGATSASVLSFQVGAGTTSDDRIDLTVVNLNGSTDKTLATVANSTATADVVLGTVIASWDSAVATSGIAIGGVDVGGTVVATTSDIDDAINVIDNALNAINDQRATYGAAQNRFEAVISNLQVSVENQSAARGRIMDADFAQETANLSRSQILQQAGNAMIAQANQMPQQVLKLLQG
jgi:flagellin